MFWSKSFGYHSMKRARIAGVGLCCVWAVASLSSCHLLQSLQPSYYLYVSNELGGISAIDVGSDGWLSQALGSPFSAGNLPTGLVASSSAKDLFVANYGDSNLSTFSIGSGGSLSLLGTSNTGPAPEDVSQAASAKYLYVADSGGVQGNIGITALSIGTNGKLTPIVGSPFTSTNLSSPWALAVATNSGGAYLYVTNINDGTVVAYTIGTDGSIKELTGSPFTVGSQPQSVAVSPDGTHLYVANAGSDTISVFTVSSDGSLTRANGSPFSTGTNPQGIEVSPNGDYLYVVNGGSSTITEYSIQSDGALQWKTTDKTGRGPAAVTATSDDKYVFVTNSIDNSISVFAVGSTGNLSEVSGSPFGQASPSDLSGLSAPTFAVVVKS